MVSSEDVMTKNTIITLEQQNKEVIPVFKIIDMDHSQSGDIDVLAEKISFFDVKELYDRAYDVINSGRQDYKAKEMMAEAIKMDMAYRCQLARKSKYKKYSRLDDFRVITTHN